MIEVYFRTIRKLVEASAVVRVLSLLTDKRDEEVGYLRGDLIFNDGSRLYFREFVHKQQGQAPERYTYAYHYQLADGETVFRYDNAPHYPNLPNAPHHKHIGNEKIVSTSPPDLEQVFQEIETLIGN